VAQTRVEPDLTCPPGGESVLERNRRTDGNLLFARPPLLSAARVKPFEASGGKLFRVTPPTFLSSKS